MKVQEVIDKLKEYQEIVGNKEVGVRIECDNTEHEMTHVGWDPFQRQIKILAW